MSMDPSSETEGYSKLIQVTIIHTTENTNCLMDRRFRLEAKDGDAQRLFSTRPSVEGVRHHYFKLSLNLSRSVTLTSEVHCIKTS